MQSLRISVGVILGSLCFAWAAAAGGKPAVRGPLYVPLDSWVYPALTRLAALGYIHDQAAGMRPWTRQECLRQLREAEAHEGRARTGEQALRLIEALRQELDPAAERPSAAIRSLYVRSLAISGEPLVDGYNFGQTVVNDYGRPYGAGENITAGVAAEASAGRISASVRAEATRAAPYSGLSDKAMRLDAELVPALPGAPNGVTRLNVIDAYAGLGLGNWVITAGRQELWWSPGESGPLSIGNNAPSVLMFRVANPAPQRLPGILRGLGAFRLDAIGGELAGHSSPARPLLNGQKLTWNPLPGMEVGFTRWSLFGGAGTRALTIGTIARNFLANSATYGGAADPGDRKSGFDFRWRLPIPGAGVTLYADSYADDEPSPLASPRRSAINPGIYIAALPGLSQWDLRVEAPSTRSFADDRGGLFFYWNNVYHDANTNRGLPLGTWAGRDGRGLYAQATYWRSARSRLEFGYRQNRVGPAFLPGGGSQSDAAVRGWFDCGPNTIAGVAAQYERYDLPVLSGRRRDLTVTVELHYNPSFRRSHRN